MRYTKVLALFVLPLVFSACTRPPTSEQSEAVPSKGLPFELLTYNTNHKSGIDLPGGPANDCVNGHVVIQTDIVTGMSDEMRSKSLKVKGKDGNHYYIIPDGEGCSGGVGALQSTMNGMVSDFLVAGSIVGGGYLAGRGGSSSESNVTVNSNAASKSGVAAFQKPGHSHYRSSRKGWGHVR